MATRSKSATKNHGRSKPAGASSSRTTRPASTPEASDSRDQWVATLDAAARLLPVPDPSRVALYHAFLDDGAARHLGSQLGAEAVLRDAVRVLPAAARYRAASSAPRGHGWQLLGYSPSRLAYALTLARALAVGTHERATAARVKVGKSAVKHNAVEAVRKQRAEMVLLLNNLLGHSDSAARTRVAHADATPSRSSDAAMRTLAALVDEAEALLRQHPSGTALREEAEESGLTAALLANARALAQGAEQATSAHDADKSALGVTNEVLQATEGRLLLELRALAHAHAAARTRVSGLPDLSLHHARHAHGSAHPASDAPAATAAAATPAAPAAPAS